MPAPKTAPLMRCSPVCCPLARPGVSYSKDNLKAGRAVKCRIVPNKPLVSVPVRDGDS